MSFLYSHAATLVAFRNGQVPGEIEFLAFMYTKYNAGKMSFFSWKFPTETGEPGKTRWQTAMDCADSELSDTPKNPAGFEVVPHGPRESSGDPMPFLVNQVPGNREKGSDWHDKCVFIVTLTPNSLDHLRKVELWDDEDELLSPPEFVEASELWTRMVKDGQPFHRAVLFRTIEYLSERRPAVYERYRTILQDPYNQRELVSYGRPIEFI